MGFYALLTAAVADLSTRGYVSDAQLDHWMTLIRAAAAAEMMTEAAMVEALKRSFRSIYERLVDRGKILERHPGATRFTLQQVKPALRTELDRRILSSAKLIKLNRQETIEKTLRRFAGWATSIPPGGSDAVRKNPVKSDIRKSLAQLPYVERRVLVDQGHKFAANLSNIMAVDGGAIALIWRSHWRQAGYAYREDHKLRDGKVYTLRGNRAIEQGLMKAGPAGYYDEVTAVGEEVFCRCWALYLYSLRQLPADMLTARGRGELAKIRIVA